MTNNESEVEIDLEEIEAHDDFDDPEDDYLDDSEEALVELHRVSPQVRCIAEMLQDMKTDIHALRSVYRAVREVFVDWDKQRTDNKR